MHLLRLYKLYLQVPSLTLKLSSKHFNFLQKKENFFYHSKFAISITYELIILALHFIRCLSFISLYVNSVFYHFSTK